MLIADAIKKVHVFSQGDIDYPTSGDDDFWRYLEGINAGINIWECEENINWMELFSTETGTLTEGEIEYSLSSTVKWPAALLTIDGTQINYQKPDESHQTEAIGSISPRFYLSGPATQKKLIIQPVPVESQDGKAWKLPVYNSATMFVTGSETTPIQMSDPYFAIHTAVALINAQKKPTLAGVHQQLANQKLRAMRIANENKPFGSIEEHYDQTYAGFGT